MMRIGYVNPEHCLVRNILSKCPEHDYIRIRSFWQAARVVADRFWFPGGKWLSANGAFVYCGGVHRGGPLDLYHFWCTVPLFKSTVPYVITTSDFIPRAIRDRSLVLRLLDNLMSDSCKKILVLSDVARLHQEMFSCENQCPELMDKVEILMPPQDLLATKEDVARRFERRKLIRFMFVGNAFWHKGGGECVRALKELRKSYPLELLIIGNIYDSDYMTCIKYDRPNELRRFLEDNSDWIKYYPKLPNEQVLELMKTCHVGLLPTRDETFGYSVLEMQASGMPVVTTDIWALPEINNEQTGWLIPVEKTPDRRAVFRGEEAKIKLCETITNGLMAQCDKILANPELIVSRGYDSLDRISEFHDPLKHAARLRATYRDCASGK